MRRLAVVTVIVSIAVGAMSLPASALSQKNATDRYIKNTMVHKKFHADNVTSVHCVGATPYTGRPGSKFTCYAYSHNGAQVGVIHGTNLGNDEANFNWYPNV